MYCLQAFFPPNTSLLTHFGVYCTIPKQPRTSFLSNINQFEKNLHLADIIFRSRQCPSQKDFTVSGSCLCIDSGLQCTDTCLHYECDNMVFNEIEANDIDILMMMMMMMMMMIMMMVMMMIKKKLSMPLLSYCNFSDLAPYRLAFSCNFRCNTMQIPTKTYKQSLFFKLISVLKIIKPKKLNQRFIYGHNSYYCIAIQKFSPTKTRGKNQ